MMVEKTTLVNATSAARIGRLCKLTTSANEESNRPLGIFRKNPPAAEDRRTEHSFSPLEPTAFLRRSARVFADRTAVVDDDASFTYAEFAERVQRIAGGLAASGVAPGDRVAVLAPNTHALLAMHYAVPLAGAVLVALNTRLRAAELTAIVRHAGAVVLVYDRDLEGAAHEIAAACAIPTIDCGHAASAFERMASDGTPLDVPVTDERGLIALNYTSGTTGTPKGVMYSHRGAYLQALAMAYHAALDTSSVYLWTLPMFHCNGWSFTWAVTAAGATHRCLRKLDPAIAWRHLRESQVTHLCAAPTVLVMLAAHEEARLGKLERPLRAFTGGAPPSPALLARMAELDIDVRHLYGLTETYGPAVISEWRPEWNALGIAEQAERKARQGVGNIVALEVRVVDGEGCDVPADGATHGEIALRGNNVMLGYYRDREATRAAIPDGWLRSGDIGVMHADGYVELRDRAKDVIISGGENIASVEVERVLESHPCVLEAAVVAAPDATWGEVPVAFVALRDGATLAGADLIAFARERMAHFKAPKRVIFGELPKTGTGKIQKFALRERVRA